LAGLLLATDDVALFPPGTLDDHGWREPGRAPAWAGTGNLQLAPGVSNPQANQGGGHGPFGPARDLAGTLYLPPDASVDDGWVARVRDRVFAVSQVRLVKDPFDPAEGISCVAMTVTSVDTWPQGGAPRA